MHSAMKKLAPREKELMEMRFGIKSGKEMTQKEVADRLFRSYHTVRTQKRTIYQKLGVSKDTELLWWMIFERLGKKFSLNLIREKGIENI